MQASHQVYRRGIEMVDHTHIPKFRHIGDLSGCRETVPSQIDLGDIDVTTLN